MAFLSKHDGTICWFEALLLKLLGQPRACLGDIQQVILQEFNINQSIVKQKWKVQGYTYDLNTLTMRNTLLEVAEKVAKQQGQFRAYVERKKVVVKATFLSDRLGPLHIDRRRLLPAIHAFHRTH
jgi:hypothetical protein